MRRPQFTLKTSLWLMAYAVCALFAFGAGRRFEHEQLEKSYAEIASKRQIADNLIEEAESLVSKSRAFENHGRFRGTDE